MWNQWFDKKTRLKDLSLGSRSNTVRLYRLSDFIDLDFIDLDFIDLDFIDLDRLQKLYNILIGYNFDKGRRKWLFFRQKQNEKSEL